MALALLLAACQTPPKGLTAQQQQALRAQGFEPAQEGWELQMSGKLLFEFDSYELGDKARTRVAELAHALMKAGIERLRVEGHTDDRGSDAYNLKLSERRAQAVAEVLVEAGMPRQNIEVKGLGRSMPVVSGGAAENRRVAIVVPLM
ncbi:OmpA family protein [Comamonas guangdongensis]|uniref:OmpA family protein n=1 Tax=Comamonas guangdongensis TaxID=510515 RepID=A0ABV3ZSC7_9BURK